MNFDRIYETLRHIFKNKGLRALAEECKELAKQFHESNERIYFPIEFDPVTHQISSTMALSYLQQLSDDDANVHLKKFIPVQIVNDSSALFRAAASLIGISKEENIRELRVQCLIKGLSKLLEYIKNNEQLLDSLLYGTDDSHWSNLIHEKELMDAPNTVTLFTLILLAEVIRIPIRSVYPSLSAQELHDNPDHIYQHLNRIYYPSHHQDQNTKISIQPITILWSFNQGNDILCPVPLFPIREQIALRSTHPTLPKDTGIPRPINIECSIPSKRDRCTYILIITTVRDSKASKTRARIKEIKETIIQRIKTVANSAHEGDIIEVNTCDEKLTDPPLISFCETIKMNIVEISNLINTIEFREHMNSNVLSCISTARNRMARQLTYYTDFFLFCDHSNDLSAKVVVQKSAIRFLKDTPSIRTRIIDSSKELHVDQERCSNPGSSQADFFFDSNDHYSHAHGNDNRERITIRYKEEHCPQMVPRLEASTTDDSNSEPRVLSVHTSVRYEGTEKFDTCESRQLSESSSFAFDRLRAPKERKDDGSNRERSFSASTNISKQFPFKPGFS